MRPEQDVIDQLADYFGWLETQLDAHSVVAPSPDHHDHHDRHHAMNTLELASPDALEVDVAVERAPTTETEWDGPSVIAARSPRRSARALLMAAAALLVVAGLWTLAGRASNPEQPLTTSMRLDSSSMAPTLLNGDTLQIDTDAYTTARPAVGDIVEIRIPDFIGEQTLVKRIVALASQTVEYRSCVLYLDGVEQPGLSLTTPTPSSASNCGADQPALLVPAGYVFVLGDNRAGSKDSRHLGPIPVTDLLGKVIHATGADGTTRPLAHLNPDTTLATTAASTTPTSQLITSFRGSDLDTSLPLVGRAWLDSMEFSLDRRTNARIYDVRMAAIASCMHDRGLDYEPVPYPDNGSYEDQVNPLDRAYARVMGYHPLPAAPIDPNIATEATTTAASDCSNAVYPSTFGRLGNYFADSDQLRSDLLQNLTGFEANDASREVTQAWALCTGNAGYNYRRKNDPILLYQDAVTITEIEIATRLADLDCDIQVGYTQAQHDWEAPRVAGWETSNREAIQVAIADRAELLDRLSELEIELFGSPRS